MRWQVLIDLRPLMALHALALLGLCAGGVAWDYPVLLPLAWAAVGVCVMAVLLPRRWRGALLPELALAAVVAWFWMTHGAALAAAGVGAQVALVELAVCAWMVVAGSAANRVWLVLPLTAALALPVDHATGRGAWLLALALLLALAEAGWHRNGMLSGRAWRAAYVRWLVAPLLGLAVVAIAVAWNVPVFVPTSWTAVAWRGGGYAQTDDVVPDLRLGASGSSVPSPDPGPAPAERMHDATVVARWLDENTSGDVYLRALAYDDVRVDAGEWRWQMAQGREPVAAAMPHGAWSTFLAVIDSPVVLRPDATSVVDVPGLRADTAGNYWYPATTSGNRAGMYRVAAGPLLVASDVAQERCRRLPPEAAALFAASEALASPPLTHWRALSAEDAAQAVTTWLQARCRYRVGTLADPPSGAGLRRFLAGASAAERSGDCRHFTTAAVLALRASGHAARAVTGFLSAERTGSAVVFRLRHAHAWVEVVAADGTWRRVDPTPAGERHAVLAAVTTAPPDPTRDLTSSPVHTPEPLPSDANSSVSTTAWWWAGFGVMSMLMVGAWWRRRQTDSRRTQVLRQMEQTLVRLAVACGVTVTPSMTMTAVCTRISERTGIDLSRYVAAHLAARYGDGPMPPPWPEAEVLTACRRRSS